MTHAWTPLRTLYPLQNDDRMSTTRCRDLAVAAGFSLFSTEYSRECYGGGAVVV